VSSGDAEPAKPPITRVIVALAASMACAGLVIAVLASGERHKTQNRALVKTSSTAAVALPSTTAHALVARSDVRPVPIDVLKTATVVAEPFAPGLRLARSHMSPVWEDRRAEIEDRTKGDVRGYAIGDLLPHGSLLVGISTTTADIMVGDTHLVRLYDDGRIEPMEDLSKAEIGGITPVSGRASDPDEEDKIRLALIDARSDDPTTVQTAIDQLIAGGDPVIDLLMPYVDSMIPVRSAEYAFPSGSELQARPKVLGEIVMLVLERITGQKFGDATREDLADEERAQMARSWRRWWKGE
jgi:hypothetical protein